MLIIKLKSCIASGRHRKAFLMKAKTIRPLRYMFERNAVISHWHAPGAKSIFSSYSVWSDLSDLISKMNSDGFDAQCDEPSSHISKPVMETIGMALWPLVLVTLCTQNEASPTSCLYLPQGLWGHSLFRPLLVRNCCITVDHSHISSGLRNGYI